MHARTLQDLASAQSNLLASEIQLLLDSSARISEATARLARDAAQGIERSYSAGPAASLIAVRSDILIIVLVSL